MLSVFLIHIWRLVLLFLFILLCFGLGRKVFKRIKIDFEDILEEFLFTFATGAFILAVLVYLLGLLGWINEFTLRVLFFIGLIWTIPQIRYLYHRLLKDFANLKSKFKSFLKIENSWLIILLIFTLFFVILNLVGVLIPEHFGDAVFYHLGEVVQYLQQGRITRLLEPEQFKWMSLMPKLTEMLYLIGVSVGKDILAKLIHFSFGILLALAVYIFSRRFFNYQAAILVAVFMYANHLIAWLSRTAYIDLSTAFYSFLAIYALFIWHLEQKRYWLILGAILIGASIGTKWLALIILFPSLFIIVYSWIYHHRTIKQILTDFAIAASLIFITTIPWTFFALYYTGNPIYPLFGLKMQPDEWTNWGRYQILKIAPPTNYYEYLTLKIWRLWPLLIYEFFFLLQPVLAIFILAWLFWREIDSKIKLLLIIGLIYFLGWTLIPIQEARYFLPVMAVLIVPAAWLWLKIFSKDKILLIFSFIFVILVLIRWVNITWKENKRYLPYIVGRYSYQTFLKKEGLENWLVPKYFYFKDEK